MPRTAAQTREHVLEVAHDLFYWQGIRATGIDRVAAEAGIAPTTLYRLFASKDDLVAAYVERSDQLGREWFTAARARAGADPRAQLRAIFDELLVQIQPDRCRGCACLMALAEFPDPALPTHQHALAAKTWIRDQLGELTESLGVADPASLADQLFLIYEGVNASTQALGADGPARAARAMVEQLLVPATRRGRR